MEIKWKDRIRIFVLCTGGVAVFPVTCNSIFAKSRRPPDDEYEDVTTTASMVPQRVRKGSGAPVSMSPMATMSVQDFENAERTLTNKSAKVPGAAGK